MPVSTETMDTDDYELYDPRIHSTLRGKIEGKANFNQAYDRGPILVNRPPKGTKSKQEVSHYGTLPRNYNKKKSPTRSDNILSKSTVNNIHRR
jgi:hypothetical protein